MLLNNQSTTNQHVRIGNDEGNSMPEDNSHEAAEAEIRANAITSSFGSLGNCEPICPTRLGTIIPFSSGNPISLNTLSDGTVGFPGLLGFGFSTVLSLSTLGPTIDLTGLGGNIGINFGFSVPCDGTITSLVAYFSTTALLGFTGTQIDITAQLYSSPTPNNIFSPIGSPVTLTFLDPPLIWPVGTIRNGRVSFSSPVTTETRLLMVFSATETDGILINTIIGYASAGIKII